MKSMKRLVGLLALLALLIVGGMWMLKSKPAPAEVEDYGGSLVAAINKAPSPTGKKGSPTTRSCTTADVKTRDTSSANGSNGDDDSDDSDDEPQTPAEKALKHWEDVIAVFYEETEEEETDETNDASDTPKPDAPSKPPRVTLDDQLRVRDSFREMDEENRMEEVHHAMNLLPDESVAVMYGVLFDKTQPEDVMDVIFSDILNRDESIKNLMMEEIAKDPTHPMYTESKRILDVIKDD